MTADPFTMLVALGGTATLACGVLSACGSEKTQAVLAEGNIVPERQNAQNITQNSAPEQTPARAPGDDKTPGRGGR